MTLEVSLDNSVPRTPVLHFTRRYRHPRERVWEALTTPEGLSKWFPCDVAIDAREGGTMTLTFPGEEAEPEVVPITEFDPPRLLAFVWSEENLRWTLEADGDECVLRLSNTIIDPEWTPRTAAGWHSCLDELEAHLDGRPQPSDAGPNHALIAHYKTHLAQD